MASQPRFEAPDHVIEPEPKIPFHLLDSRLEFTTSTNVEEARTKEIKISDFGEYLGKGSFCDWVRLAEISLLDEDRQETIPHKFALKHYSEPAHNNVAWSLDGYNLLKKAGLKTWTTYRINKDENLALMTYGNWDDKSLLSPNNDDGCELSKRLFNNRLEEIDNFDEVIDDLLGQVKLATEKRLKVAFDSYGFFVPNDADQKRHAPIDFIYSDLDLVREVKLTTEEDLLKENIKAMGTGLIGFLIQYGTTNLREKCEAQFSDRVYREYGIEFFYGQVN